MSVRAITDEEVTVYDERGWAFLPGLVDRETAAGLNAIAEATMAGEAEFDHGDLVARSFGIHRGDARDGGLSAEVALSPVMGRNVARLLRARQVRLETDTLLSKAPLGKGRQDATIYHQDYPGHSFDRSHFLTVWIALTDLPAQSGTMRFLEGSHRHGVFGNVFIGDGVDLFEEHPWLTDLPLSPPLDMCAGDATVHHALTIHGAPPNRSDAMRTGRTLIYFDAGTLYRGGEYQLFAGVELKVNEPFDHPAFPLVPQGTSKESGT